MNPAEEIDKEDKVVIENKPENETEDEEEKGINENEENVQDSDEFREPKIWIGFDLSTQQLKSIAIDENLEVICEASVNFDADLPEYR